MRLPSLLVLLVLLIACNTSEETTAVQKVRDPEERLASHWQKVKESKPLVKDGDLITRTGADIISASLSNFNKRDKTYPHCGVAFIEDGEVYVYHTMAGDENPSGIMMRQPLDSFCNPTRKNGFGIFRYNLSKEELVAYESIIKDYFSDAMLFDADFNLKQDSTMYCAEIVYKALKQSTKNRIILPTTTIKNYTFKQVGFKSRTIKELDYVAIDNLYMNPYCKEITRVKFD